MSDEERISQLKERAERLAEWRRDLEQRDQSYHDTRRGLVKAKKIQRLTPEHHAQWLRISQELQERHVEWQDFHAEVNRWQAESGRLLMESLGGGS